MNKIKKTNWVNNFKLVGKAVVGDYTFKLDEVSDSGWQYNSMSLGIDCGEEYGTIYANMMGGFSTKNNSEIWVHGKKEDGTDDFKESFTVAWKDRLNEDILDSVGDFCFLKVGLETTNEGKTFVNKFLSAYDAVNYIAQHIESGMVLNVQGNMRYNFYNGKVSTQREITSIFLSKAEPENYKATFTQSVLLGQDSIDLKNNIDKDKGCLYIDTTVIDYVKELNGVEIKSQYPLPFRFEYAFSSGDSLKKLCNSIFKVKPETYTQINFDGKFVNTGAVVQATMEDVPDDIKDLIALGLYTEEEILTKYAINGAVERRYILTKPVIKMEGDADHKVPSLQVFPERYTEDELIVDAGVSADSLDEVLSDAIDDDGLDWLDSL